MKTVKRKRKNIAIKQTQCPICNIIVYGDSFRYKMHLYKHKAIKPRFKCTFCFKEFYRRDSYEKHVAIHTGVRRYYICDYCDRNFVDKRSLIKHLTIHDEYESKREYKCMACGIKYCEERLLKYHIRKEHYNLNKTTVIYENKMANDTWVEPIMESKFCVQITKISNNSILIKKSPTTIELTNPKEIENSQFKSYMSSVFAEIDHSHYSKAICDYCNKEMLKKSLIPHIRERHLKLKRFKCDVCSASFNRRYMLVDHKCGQLKMRKRNLTVS